MTREQTPLGKPENTEEHAVQMHILNLMERGHTVLPDPSDPSGELLLTTCDMDTIRRCVREQFLHNPQIA